MLRMAALQQGCVLSPAVLARSMKAPAWAERQQVRAEAAGVHRSTNIQTFAAILCAPHTVIEANTSHGPHQPDAVPVHPVSGAQYRCAAAFGARQAAEGLQLLQARCIPDGVVGHVGHKSPPAWAAV